MAPGMEVLEVRTMLHAAASTAAIAAISGADVASASDRRYVERLIGSEALASRSGRVLRDRMVAALEHGTPRTTVALRILRDPAGLGQDVESAYRVVLGRAPSRAELQAGRQLIGAGADSRSLVARLVGRPEFLARHGNDPGQAVTALFQIILHRNPSAAERSAWTARAAGRSPRRMEALARAFLRSPEGLEVAARSTLLPQAAADPAILRAALKTVRRPGGLLRAQAAGLASTATYTWLADPSTVLETDPRVTQPIMGLVNDGDFDNNVPQAPGFNLRSAVNNLPSTVSIGLIGVPVPLNLTSLGADGSLWASDGMTLYQLAPGATAWTILGSPGIGTPLTDLAAVSSTTLWALAGSSILTDSGGAWAYVSALPNDDTPKAIAAGDATAVYVLGSSGQIYEYNSGQQAWSTIPGGPADSIVTIKAGGTAYLAAVTTGTGPSARGLWTYTAGNGWQQVSGAPALSDAAIGGDGSLWVWTDRGTSVAVQNPDGSWTIPPQASLLQAGQTIEYVMAQSISAAVVIVSPTSTSPWAAPMQLLYGLLDRPTVPFPAFTETGQVTSYNAITTALGLINPLGVRSQYANTDFNVQHAISTVQMMTAPAGVSNADWQAVQQQILTELNDVQTIVDNLYGNVYQLINDLGTLSNTVFVTAADKVLGSVNGPDSNQTATLVLEGLADAILWGIAAAGLPAGAAVATSFLASAVGSVFSGFLASNPPDANGAVDIKAGQLGQTIADQYTASLLSASNDEKTILSNWNTLQAVGQQLSSGAWDWDVTQTPAMVAAAEPAFELYFLQALMPAKWQIIGFAYADYQKYPLSQSLDAPTYDVYTQPQGYKHGRPWEYVYFLNQQGANKNPFDDQYVGPYPSQDLIDTLFDDLNVSQYDFWMGNGGWGEIPYFFVKPA
ncbi:WD40/YVTN/BNR-like repeat-containing protein [Aquisphaera insulae]|uniref:WD40/YVTN/BNR-like repeat-containing protein n=1 Tax=Aquisphaera insulae TaxID=2712864 RepID=UPI0013EB0B10|nr:hypothetical protein [Aquisphaera insulae]